MKLAASVEKKAIERRRYLHTHAEVGDHELETSAFILKTLSEMGLSPRKIGSTGVCAVVKGAGEGRHIALRADIDALPEETGAAHLCGHDVHTAILLTVAELLTENKSSWTGAVTLVFQPAEETLNGAREMIAGGVLDDPKVECIAGLHVWPEIAAGSIGIRRGPMMAASDTMTVKFTGRQGHAARPHMCIDPITMAGHFISDVQAVVAREISALDSAVLSFGKIEGGTAANIIPSSVTLSGTLRSLRPEVRDALAEAVARFASATADSMRGRADVDIIKGTPVVISSPELCDILETEAVGLLGKEKVQFLPEPTMGGEDFAFYLEKVPGLFFRLGCAGEGQNFPLHSPSFEPDERCIKTGVALMLRMAVRLAQR